MKEKKEKPKYVKICPNCKSIDVGSERSTMQQTGILPTRYICNNCGFASFAFPEIDLNDYEKIPKKENTAMGLEKGDLEKIDTSYGKFIVRVVWKYVSIILILFGLVSLIFVKNRPAWLLISDISTIVLGLIMFYITFFRIKEDKKK